MAYTKTTWTTSVAASASLMNHMETQWTEITAIAAAHDHNTRYYTKTLSDATFFSLTYFNNFDADKLDTYDFSGLVSSILPIGAIMLWKGSDANVPDNWFVCDGAAHGGYTTPNLRERFVIGAGGAYAVGDTGEPGSWNGTITPTGTVTVGVHTLTTAELPAHTHNWTEWYSPVAGFSSGGGGITKYAGTTTTPRTIDQQTTGGGSHGHTGSTASFTAIDPRPAYYSLYYIMKCA